MCKCQPALSNRLPHCRWSDLTCSLLPGLFPHLQPPTHSSTRLVPLPHRHTTRHPTWPRKPRKPLSLTSKTCRRRSNPARNKPHPFCKTLRPRRPRRLRTSRRKRSPPPVPRCRASCLLRPRRPVTSSRAWTGVMISSRKALAPPSWTSLSVQGRRHPSCRSATFLKVSRGDWWMRDFRRIAVALVGISADLHPMWSPLAQAHRTTPSPARKPTSSAPRSVTSSMASWLTGHRRASSSRRES